MDVTFSPALRVYAEMWEIAGRRRAADAQFAQALTHIRSGTPDAMAKAFDLFTRSGAHNFTEAQFAARMNAALQISRKIDRWTKLRDSGGW